MYATAGEDAGSPAFDVGTPTLLAHDQGHDDGIV
jgi:hypothetical protein